MSNLSTSATCIIHHHKHHTIITHTPLSHQQNTLLYHNQYTLMYHSTHCCMCITVHTAVSQYTLLYHSTHCCMCIQYTLLYHSTRCCIEVSVVKVTEIPPPPQCLATTEPTQTLRWCTVFSALFS